MNIEIKEIKETEEEIAKMNDDKLALLERITFQELIKREAKKMILRLIDQQK